MHPAQIMESVPGGTAGALAALLLVVVTWYFFTHRRHALGAHAPPAGVPVLPGALPLLGNLGSVLANASCLHDMILDQTLAVSGRTWCFSVPCMPLYIVVSTPKNLEHVLKTRADNYIKGAVFQANLGPLLGRGIFTVDGQEWYGQRKLAAHIFNVKSFKRYVGNVFAAKFTKLCSLLNRAADASAAAATPPAAAVAAAPPAPGAATPGAAPPGAIDLHALMYAFTLDSFSHIAFGSDPGCLEAAPHQLPFALAFDSAQKILNNRFWLPGWRVMERLTGMRRQLNSDIATVRDFASAIVRDFATRAAAADAAACAPAAAATGVHVHAGSDDDGSDGGEQPGAGGAAAGAPRGAPGADDRAHAAVDDATDGGTLLSMFMGATDARGRPLSPAALVDTVLNFIIAGRDTTAQALSWTLYMVMQNPGVEAALLQEAQSVLGPAVADGGGGGALPSYEQLRQLRYAHAVFWEGLRLYPSVPQNCKFAAAPDVLPDGTKVPAGALLLYAPYAINRLPSVWGDDAMQFRPERWLCMEKLPSAYEYPSFNAGPRICLGKSLAELEGVFVLVGLLRTFRLTMLPGQDVRYVQSTSLPMESGLMVTVARRGG